MKQKPGDLASTCPASIKRLPPLSDAEITEFKKGLPGRLPDAVRDLLRFCSGFECATGETVLMTGAGDVGFGNAIPHSLAVMGYGFGNFWVVDVNSQGEWGLFFTSLMIRRCWRCRRPIYVTFYSNFEISVRA